MFTFFIYICVSFAKDPVNVYERCKKNKTGTAGNKVKYYLNHDKLLLASMLRPLHQVTEEMLDQQKL